MVNLLIIHVLSNLVPASYKNEKDNIKTAQIVIKCRLYQKIII